MGPCSLARVVAQRFWIETLGCPKNAVDTEKMMAGLLADGLERAETSDEADLVVVNTCAFIDAAREESVDVLLALSAARKAGAKVVATGCMAERYGDELAAALPEADAVIGFAGAPSIASAVGMAVTLPTEQPVSLLRKPTGVRDLLELTRPKSQTPWAYLKVAEGCDRACAFCAIPTFRGAQRSRTPEAIVAEARALVEEGVRELILVAQDLAWYGRDTGNPGALAPLLRAIDPLRADGLERVRLLYLYPSEVKDPLISTMLDLPSVVPYFDLSLQHASRSLLARMKRWGSGVKFLAMIEAIRSQQPDAVFRSSFISGFPGESEAMHEELLEFLDAAQLDWAGFFAYSQEDGTTAAKLDGAVETIVMRERLSELHSVQEPITGAARAALIGSTIEVLIDGHDNEGDAGVSAGFIGRSFRETPEIDGVVRIGIGDRPDRGKLYDAELLPSVGSLLRVAVLDCEGPDLYAEAVSSPSLQT